MRTPFLLCSLILLLCTSVRAQNPLPRYSAPELDSLHQDLTAIAARREITGFGAALVTADGMLFEQGYGYADLQTQTPYTPRSVQNIASISKTFLGIALVQAERAGHLSLEDPINQYLPFKVVHPRYPDRPILLRHLANHTAGINDGKMYDKAYALTTPLTVAKGDVPGAEYREMKKVAGNTLLPLDEFLVAFLTPSGKFYRKKNFTKTAPGATYEYSNVGAALAAYVLEQATGVAYPEWTRQHIFEPAGMENTGWLAADIKPGTHITHHFSNGLPMPDYALSTYPDGGLRTSIHDLGVYCSAAIQGRASGNAILPAAGYARLLSDTVRVEEEKSVYGYFWERLDSGFYGHTGGDPGVVTLMFVNEDTGVGHLAFFNGSAKSNEVYMEVFRTVVKWGERWGKQRK